MNKSKESADNPSNESENINDQITAELKKMGSTFKRAAFLRTHSIDDLIAKDDFISVMEKLLSRKLDYDTASLGIYEGKRKRKKRRLTSFENRLLEGYYEERYKIYCMFARSGDYIYKEAVRLQLPTRPYTLLHLSNNWDKSNDAETDDLMDKAHNEILQLILEAEAVIPKMAGGKVVEQLADIKQTSDKAGKITQLTDTEDNILEALGENILTGEKLSIKAGYPYNSNFKSTLASLRKRGILGNNAPGYFVQPKYRHPLKSDKGQDERQD